MPFDDVHACTPAVELEKKAAPLPGGRGRGKGSGTCRSLRRPSGVLLAEQGGRGWEEGLPLGSVDKSGSRVRGQRKSSAVAVRHGSSSDHFLLFIDFLRLGNGKLSSSLQLISGQLM